MISEYKLCNQCIFKMTNNFVNLKKLYNYDKSNVKMLLEGELNIKIDEWGLYHEIINILDKDEQMSHKVLTRLIEITHNEKMDDVYLDERLYMTHFNRITEVLEYTIRQNLRK